MSSNELSFNRLEVYKNDLEIIQLGLEQLKKDFVLAGIEFNEKRAGKVDFPAALRWVEAVVKDLSTKNPDRLRNLLYRIDLEEWRIQKTARESVDLPFEKLVAELILMREIQKVVIRKHYRDKGK